MFTDEFIIKACEYTSKARSAMDARNELRKLGINNKEVNQELDNIVAASDAHNILAVNYIYSFVPEDLRQLLEVIKVTGAFATSYSSNNRFSMSTSIRLHLKTGVLDLLFDNTNKCLYTNEFFSNSDKYFEEISKYIKPNPKGFYSWIVVLK